MNISCRELVKLSDKGDLNDCLRRKCRNGYHNGCDPIVEIRKQFHFRMGGIVVLLLGVAFCALVLWSVISGTEADSGAILAGCIVGALLVIVSSLVVYFTTFDSEFKERRHWFLNRLCEFCDFAGVKNLSDIAGEEEKALVARTFDMIVPYASNKLELEEKGTDEDPEIAALKDGNNKKIAERFGLFVKLELVKKELGYKPYYDAAREKRKQEKEQKATVLA